MHFMTPMAAKIRTEQKTSQNSRYLLFSSFSFHGILFLCDHQARNNQGGEKDNGRRGVINACTHAKKKKEIEEEQLR